MDNQKRKITNRMVDEIEVRTKEFVVWDSVIPGFGLRVRPSGGKSFIFTYRSEGGRAGKVQRVTIGNATKLKADPAREEAKRLAALHFAGVDTAEEKAAERVEIKAQKDAPTVSDLLDRFLKDHARPTLKAKTADEYERLIEKILKPEIGTIKVAALATKDVSEMHHRLREKPTQAALAVRVLSSAITCGIEWGLREAGSNPAKIRLKGSRRRERLFSDAEVVRLKAAIDQLEKDGKIMASVALGLRLLFESGCRAGEVCALRWSNIDFDEDVMRWSDTKTGALEKAMTSAGKRLLQAAYATRDRLIDFVCPSSIGKQLRVETLECGFEKAMKLANVSANENASLHLIRHYFSSKTYNDPDIPLPIAMKIVGHKSVQTAMRYAHVAQEELRKATLKAERKRAAALKVAENKGKVLRFPDSGGNSR